MTGSQALATMVDASRAPLSEWTARNEHRWIIGRRWRVRLFDIAVHVLFVRYK